MTAKLRKAIDRYFDDRNASALRRALVGQTGHAADAAREALKGGSHDGPCDHSLPDGACVIHVRTSRRRENVLAECIGEYLDYSNTPSPEVQ